jgi:hypothetical protein
MKALLVPLALSLVATRAIAVPRVVHNLAWGGPDGRTLYLCASDRLYRIDVLIPGPLP